MPVYNSLGSPSMETSIAKTQPSKLPISSVRVIIRVRPFLSKEIQENGGMHVSCAALLDRVGAKVTVHLKDHLTSRNEYYKLDSFFGEGDPIAQIFHKEVSSMIPGIFHGLSATVFAYGATGSGKTYTMQGTESEHGLILLTMLAILSLSKGMQSQVGISYYEVYMDRCYDLLEPKAKEIMALDDENGNLQLKGLSLIPVFSMNEFHDIFSKGLQRRKVAHTKLNDVSSRSHAVLVISVRNGGDKGKLNLIDLAGNEDNRRTCNKGIRLQESATINKSLLALSNVIHALNNNEQRIPFRESKLTRILQDSLGGGNAALMIACLNPVSYQESVHTVSLAARTCHIANYFGSAKRKVPTELVDMEEKLRAWLESKGKTKSIQRMNGPFSPPVCKTPTSLFSNSNKLKHNGTSIKVKKAESLSLDIKGRKLFNFEAQSSFHIEVANENKENETSIERKKDDATKFSGKMIERKQKLHDSSQKSIFLPIKSSNNQLSCDNTSFHVQDSEDPTNQLSSSSQNCGEFEETSTRLDKFKELLVEEYISFLNIASKEELMLLKGIGQKRAERILELRKSSFEPLKSLSDLEKIGLSSKQVRDLLKRGTRGFFV